MSDRVHKVQSPFSPPRRPGLRAESGAPPQQIRQLYKIIASIGFIGIIIADEHDVVIVGETDRTRHEGSN
jgi:hypothetical protein